MDFKKGHVGDSIYFQIDVPYDVCTGKDKTKNRVVEMHNHLKPLDKKINFSYKSWGIEKQADYFYIQEVQVNKPNITRATGHIFVQTELLFADETVQNMQPGKKESQTLFRFDIDKRFQYGAEKEGQPLFVVLHKCKPSEIWQKRFRQFIPEPFGLNPVDSIYKLWEKDLYTFK